MELTRRRAALILTYTEEALAGIPARHRQKARPIVHIGVLESDYPVASMRLPPTPFTVLSGGRLVHWKGFDLLVEAFAKFGRGRDARLVFTGDGPYRQVLERLAEERGVREQVIFLGNFPRARRLRGSLQGCTYTLCQPCAMGRPSPF